LSVSKGTLFSVQFEYIAVTDEAFSYLQGTIHSLKLHRCTGYTSNAFQYLKSIHTLMLFNESTIIDAFLYLKETNINTLLLRRCKKVSVDKAVRYLPDTIRFVQLLNCNFTDRTLKYLHGKIEIFDSDSPDVTDRGLRYLHGTIRSLNIYGTDQITSRGIKYLHGTIQSLNITNCGGITDEAFQYVRDTIQTLEIEEMDVTDAAIMHLQGSSTLQSLSIYSCNRMTDEVFKYLAELRNLRKLSIEECEGISDEGIENFVKTNTHIVLFFD
jgi:hypothetical protein